MATVALESVTKKYDETLILKDISLAIEKSEFVALVGPSGSGKSTLLRLVAGLESVSSGRILINSQCVNTIPASQRDMAMVFQSYALYPHMTVYDNIAYGLKLRKTPKTAIQKRVKDVCELLQLQNLLQRKPQELSGGQRQRVAMGRAIVRSPSVFLFDEPLSNLDAKLRTQMRYEIKKIHQTLRTTCLYVTHDQTEAMTLADKIVILNQGIIEQIGTPKSVYLKPESLFVASFIGHYPMNVFKGVVDKTRQKIITDIGLECPLPKLHQETRCGDEVFIGIRAEHLDMQSSKSFYSIDARIKFVEDMGADKLVQVITTVGQVALTVRVHDEAVFSANNLLRLNLLLHKARVFCTKSGNYLGGWHE